jgi:hypothetical protein
MFASSLKMKVAHYPLLMLCGPLGFLLYHVSAPIICWIGILLLLDAVIRKRPRGFLSILLTLVLFLPLAKRFSRVSRSFVLPSGGFFGLTI